eukprot:scaffold126593_cov38-Prasinocladus_malaysianus.AAC.2
MRAVPARPSFKWLILAAPSHILMMSTRTLLPMPVWPEKGCTWRCANVPPLEPLDRRPGLTSTCVAPDPPEPSPTSLAQGGRSEGASKTSGTLGICTCAAASPESKLTFAAGGYIG